MRKLSSVCGAAALACALVAGAASAAQEPPSAADILFERPQLQALKPGDGVDYSYSFRSADPNLFGPSFDDRIGLRVEPGAAPDKKKVAVEMFSAERRRAAGPFEDMSGNPLLSLMLEENLQRLAAVFQANPRYIKTAIRLALRDAAATPDSAGDSWRVEVAPFKNDPHKARMHGLDTLTYTFRVSAAAPGEITEIDIAARDAKGDVLFEETTRYAGKH
ncbi:hypothetical protein M2322_001103 [Rhodoblastus acidophilus]|uniref:hypothetical protein n=1 Tax=Rhodoblastus acidophilus TaxID=1074 RepID=UPI0022248595|nr:hypothetical protein [Rhodoblastus acidophilus]MCW2315569.1 hypothetical protein [Rhodoblastus acidophilus]